MVSDVETNVRTGLPSYTLQYRIVCPDGQTRWVYDYSVVIKNPRGEITHFDGYVMDITDRVRAEELVRAQRDLALELGVLSDLEPALCKCLSTASQLSGFDAGGILLWDGKGGLQLKVFQGISDEQARPLSYFDADSVLARAVVEGKPRYGFVSPGTAESLSSAGLRAGAILPLVQDHRPIGAMVVASRTTDDVPAETKGVLEAIAAQTGHAIARLAAEQDKAALAEQLRHAQKLEAIGRLAGGIAHDFNNILTAIMGYTEMLLTMTGPGDPLRIDLQEIDKASHRAADLTRQLLAFGRKQIIAPKVVNLNEIIQRGQRMLERLIGEDIELVATPAVGLGNVKVDPGQIEQVLINLAVNSRDAMPEGGVLAIETANVAFDDAYCRRCPEALPGDWAMLAVTDTGTGMDEDIKRHLFEPFFTTKEKDKGTGLGLATVYGIVKQSGGFLSVFTEVGVGSSFKVYLPRVEEEAVAIEKPAVAILPRGRETVLLVEDEAAVRTLTRKVLERHGYTVLEAAGAGEAFILFEKHPRRIHLLLTDVIMPSLNGRELYDRLCRIKPSLKVLYMSGYNEDVIALRGVLEPGTMFIQKPFTIEALVRKVRETLDIRRKVG